MIMSERVTIGGTGATHKVNTMKKIKNGNNGGIRMHSKRNHTDTIGRAYGHVTSTIHTYTNTAIVTGNHRRDSSSSSVLISKWVTFFFVTY